MPLTKVGGEHSPLNADQLGGECLLSNMKKALIIINKKFGIFREKQPLIADVYNNGFVYKNSAIPKDCADIIAYAKPEKTKPLIDAVDILKSIKKSLSL